MQIPEGLGVGRLLLPLWAALVLAALATSAVAAGTPLHGFRTALRAEQERLGHAPPLEALVPLLKAAGLGTPGNAVDSELFSQAWQELAAVQRPRISREELGTITARREDRLRNVRVRYRSECLANERMTPEWNDRFAAECGFVRSGGRLLFETRTGRVHDGYEEMRIRSFDGRFVRERRGSIGSDSDHLCDTRRAQGEDAADYLGYLDVDNPLALSLTLDWAAAEGATAVDGEPGLARVLSSPTAFVQERPVVVGGRECLLIDAGGGPILLDPACGYAVVRRESTVYRSERDAAGGLSLVPDGGSTIDLSDYRLVDGIWLPFRAVVVSKHGGKARTTNAAVAAYDLPEDIPLETFVRVFPLATVLDQLLEGM